MTDRKQISRRFTLVRMGEHGPVIRWGAVCFIIAGGLLAFSIAELVQFFVFQTPLRLGLLSAMFTVHLAYLSTALEFQRQNLNAIKTRFRFNLTYLFVMTLLAAVFFGSITNEHRVSQRGFQRNDEIRVELDTLATCKRLNYLNFDRKKISDAQFDQLSKQLPDTKINGVSYRERQLALQK